MKLVEILKEIGIEAEDIYDLNYSKDIETVVDQNMTGYDQGCVISETVFKVLVDGPYKNKFFKFESESNSWEEYTEDFQDIEVVEVAPVQVSVTQYHPVA